MVGNDIALPRGVITKITSQSTTAATTTETVTLTTPSFTAETGRLYRLTYSEPAFNATSDRSLAIRIRLTTVAGTLLAFAEGNTGTLGANNTVAATVITTLTAGSTVLVATALANTSTINRDGQTGKVQYLLVEDIGVN